MVRRPGVARVFSDIVRRKSFERPGLAQFVDHARLGDRLCVTRLDRLPDCSVFAGNPSTEYSDKYSR